MLLLTKYLKISFLSFLIFSFFIDSGGPLGIRNLSFALVVLSCASILYRWNYLKFNNKISSAYILFFAVAVYSFIVSQINGIGIPDIIIWLVPFLAYPIFCYAFSSYNKKIIILSVVTSGYMFSLSVILVFICLLLFGDLVTVFFYNINFPGWFYIRSDGYPQVYFQATLCLVVVSIYSYLNDYKKSAYLFVVVLGMCLSRFGVLTVFIFCLMSRLLSEQRLAKYLYRIYIIVVLIFLYSCFVFYLFFESNITMDGSGFAIRFGHVISVIDTLLNDNMFLGMGPGSTFYSMGFGSETNNIEISQLEIIRKYGLVGYFIINLAYFFVIKYFYSVGKNKELICLMAFYFVSYSNPVLLTFNLSLFVGLFFSDSKKIKLTAKDFIDDKL